MSDDCQIGERRYPKARKQHSCAWCPEPIVAGEIHAAWTWVDRTPLTVRVHLDCEAAMDRDPDLDPMEGLGGECRRGMTYEETRIADAGEAPDDPA